MTPTPRPARAVRQRARSAQGVSAARAVRQDPRAREAPPALRAPTAARSPMPAWTPSSTRESTSLQPPRIATSLTWRKTSSSLVTQRSPMPTLPLHLHAMGRSPAEVAPRARSTRSPCAETAVSTCKLVIRRERGIRPHASKSPRLAPPVRPSSEPASPTERSRRRARRPASGRSAHACTPPAPPTKSTRSRARCAENKAAPARPPTRVAENGAPTRRARSRGRAQQAARTSRHAENAARIHACAIRRALGTPGALAPERETVRPALPKRKIARSFFRSSSSASAAERATKLAVGAPSASASSASRGAPP